MGTWRQPELTLGNKAVQWTKLSVLDTLCLGAGGGERGETEDGYWED